MIIDDLISVIVPVYNGERYLHEALNSVLGQSYSKIEIIVVDDGSTDRTKDIVGEFPSTNYLYKQNEGPSAARNEGVRASRGEFLAFLDADDVWRPHKLEIMMAHLQDNPDHDGAISHVETFLQPGEQWPTWATEEMKQGPMLGYIPSSLVIRTPSFHKVGFWNKDFRLGEGAEWFARAKDSGIRLAQISDVLWLRRVHGGNATNNNDAVRSGVLRALKASIDRKRRQTNK